MCESVSFLFYSLACCIFEIAQISDIIQYLSFSVWLTALSIILSKAIHVAANNKNLLFNGWVVFHRVCVCVCVYIFFIHSSVDEHLVCFYILVIVNNVTMNIGVHTSFWISVFSFFLYIPRGGVAGSVVVLFLLFWETSKLSHNGCVNLHSH